MKYQIGIYFLTLLSCLADLLQAQPPAAIVPGPNLVVEGVPPIPVSLAEKVARYTEFRAATLSDWHPTKREMLIATRFGDTNQVHRVKFPGGARTQLTFFADSVGGASYPPKTADYFVFSKGAGGNERFQLYRFDTGTGNVVLLTDGKSRNGSPRFANQGDKLVYTSTRRNGADVDLFVMDPLDPKTNRTLLELKGGGWFPLDWSPDDRLLLVGEYVSINESYLWLVEEKTGAKELLTPRGGNVAVAYGGGAFSRDGKGFYVTTDLDSEFRRLAYIDMETKKPTILTGHIKWDVESFALSPDGKTIAFLVNEDGVETLRLMDTGTKKELSRPQLFEGSVTGIQWHNNGVDLGFNLVSARSPSDVYSLDVTSGKVERWTHSETGGLNTEKFAEPQLVRWKSFDDRAISGFLYQPPARFKGKRPVVIDIHGGPESQFRPGFLARKNYFLDEMGLALIFPNVRGSAGYGKTFLGLDNGFLREDAYKDIDALLDWIAKRPDLDAERIMVTGGSYGGHMTLAVATYYAAKIRCAVDIVGISNLATLLENTESYRRDLRRVEYGDERDPKMRAFMDRIAPVNNPQKITKPLFVIQGKNDPRVPLSEAEQMVNAVRKVGTPVWYLMAKDEGHGFAKKKNADFQFYATVRFMEEYLLDKKGQADQENEDAVSALKKIGGKFTRGPKEHGEPIVGLDLSETGITGAGMKLLAGLKKLETLKLAGVDIGDAGMKELRELKNLRSLDLTRVNLTDAGLVYLKELPHLHTLNLTRAWRLKDPGLKAIKDIKGLQELNLTGTQVTDAGLKELKELKNLHTLNLARTKRVTNAALAELKAIQSLRNLNLSGTKVTDEGIDHLKELKGLRDLNLSSTEVRGGNLADLKELKGLTLSLADTPVRDQALVQVSALPGLEALDLSDVQVTGVGLAQLRRLKGLHTLALDRRSLTSSTLAEVRQLKSLRTLRLSRGGMTEADFRGLKDLPNLRTLGLNGIDLTDAGPQALENLGTSPALDLRPVFVTDAEIKDLVGNPDLETPKAAVTRCITDAGLKALLAGRRPPQQLLWLSLHGTHVTDEGLAELKAFSGLKDLDLSRTPVSDEGLKHLAALPGLQSLDLSHTGVTGAGFSGQKTLQMLNLAHSRASGAGLKQLPSLADLNLSHCPITAPGLKELEALPKLQSLDLSNTQTTNETLKELKGFKGLRTLNIAHTPVNHLGLKELAPLKDLQTLILAGIKVTDKGLAEIKVFRDLRGLDLTDSEVTDAGLKEIGGLTNLQTLILFRVPITDAGVKELRNLKNLETLVLAVAKVTDAGLKEIKDLKRLRSLNLGGNPISDAGLKELKEMRNLQTLFLYFTSITDAGLKELKGFQELEELWLTGAGVTDAGMAELKALPKLQRLWVPALPITDAGLKAVKEIKTLQHLGLSGTRVTDAGMKEVKELKELRLLNLQASAVTDAGLRELKVLKNLEAIHLYQTGVTEPGIQNFLQAVPKCKIHRYFQ